MLKVESIIRQMPLGESHPFLVVCNDNKQYVMKFQQEEAIGSKTLFNELFGSKLVQYLELPQPNFNIAKLDQKVIDANQSLVDVNAIAGKVFVTEYRNFVPAANPVRLAGATNKKQFLGIILFDQLIVNEDRGENRGNWLLDTNTLLLNVLDHDRILKNQQFWNTNSLRDITRIPPYQINSLDSVEYKYLIQTIGGTRGVHEFDFYVRKLKAITDEILTELIDVFPDEWKNGKDLTDEDLESLKTFLKYQVEHIDEIVAYLVTKFKL